MAIPAVSSITGMMMMNFRRRSASSIEKIDIEFASVFGIAPPISAAQAAGVGDPSGPHTELLRMNDASVAPILLKEISRYPSLIDFVQAARVRTRFGSVEIF